MKKKILGLIITLCLVPESGALLLMPIIFSDYPSNNNIEKIAAFFWASNMGCEEQNIINGYIDILEKEGYTKFFQFNDTDDFKADFQNVANYEDFNDILFFYLWGHGANNGNHSLTQFAPGKSTVWSNQFRDMCDTLDSSLIGSLVESCSSGDWSDDMIGGNYLAISSSWEKEVSVGTARGGKFSEAFFNAIKSGSNAIDAYKAGQAVVNAGGYIQLPKLCNESIYDFFAN